MRIHPLDAFRGCLCRYPQVGYGNATVDGREKN